MPNECNLHGGEVVGAKGIWLKVAQFWASLRRDTHIDEFWGVAFEEENSRCEPRVPPREGAT